MKSKAFCGRKRALSCNEVAISLPEVILIGIIPFLYNINNFFLRGVQFSLGKLHLPRRLAQEQMHTGCEKEEKDDS